MGRSERVFSATVRRIVQDVLPYTRAPLTGEKLGRFIIEKVMPPYIEAAEIIVDKLRQEGTLGDILRVEDRCAEAVAKRSTATPAHLAEEIAAMLSEVQFVPPEPDGPS